MVMVRFAFEAFRTLAAWVCCRPIPDIGRSFVRMPDEGLGPRSIATSLMHLTLCHHEMMKLMMTAGCHLSKEAQSADFLSVGRGVRCNSHDRPRWGFLNL